ncbi:MAG: hypothetical protein LKJ88_07235 [Bacilli bacterium]|jgi:O-antigen ligase|nr:hypothetical protein [Bacilli bacterium]
MREQLLNLEKKTSIIFNSAWFWLFVMAGYFVSWYFFSHTGSFIVALIVSLLLLIFQSDIRLAGANMLFGFFSVSKMPYFNTMTWSIWGLIAALGGGMLLIYLKRIIVFRRCYFSWGSIGLSTTLLIFFYLISGIVNNYLRQSTYNGYGFLTLAFCLIYLAIYLMLVSGGDRDKRDFLCWEFYLVNIFVCLECFTFYFRNPNHSWAFELGWGNKNVVSIALEVALPFAARLFSKDHRRIDALVLVFIDLFLIIASLCRAGAGSVLILGPLLAIILVMDSSHNKPHDVALCLGIVGLFFTLGLWLPGEIKDAFIRILDMGGDVSSRKPIWDLALKYFYEDPILGGSFSALFEIYHDMGWEGLGLMLAHNTYLTLLASGGLICLLIYFFQVFETVYTAIKAKGSFGLALIYVILISLLHGLLDNTFFALSFMLPYLVIFAEPSLSSFGDKCLKGKWKRTRLAE